MAWELEGLIAHLLMLIACAGEQGEFAYHLHMSTLALGHSPQGSTLRPMPPT